MAPLAVLKQTKELVQKMSLKQLKRLRAQIDARIWALRPHTNPQIASETFAVPELLEHILLHADFTDVFVCMRVSRSFDNTIRGSIKLQRKLLRVQDNDLAFEAVDDITTSYATLPTYNPLIEPALEAIGFVQSGARYLDDPEFGPDSEDTTVFEICYSTTTNLLCDFGGEGTALKNRRLQGRRVSIGNADGKNGSWSETFVTACPMPVHVWFSLGRDPYDGDGKSEFYYLEPEDATMGALYDLALGARRALRKRFAPTAVQHFFGLPSGPGAVR